LTPNEWWQNHLHPALDLVTGFAYLVFFLHYIGVSAYFTFWLSKVGTAKASAAEIARRSDSMVWSFLWFEFTRVFHLLLVSSCSSVVRIALWNQGASNFDYSCECRWVCPG
jgi:hypothetical protein